MSWRPEDERVLHQLTVEQVEAAICEDYRDWAQQCHSVSLEIVRSDLFKQVRVARGSALGVFGQHSWVVLGDDCFDMRAPILDATLWSYDSDAPILWRGTGGRHRPHGYGFIYDGPRPLHQGGETIELTPAKPLSDWAERFLSRLLPLDHRGWATLAHAPVLGWPAAEIIEAMLDTPELRALVPIDIAGMLTDRNPGGLYLREEVTADGTSHE